jgi:hypothetical protein
MPDPRRGDIADRAAWGTVLRADQYQLLACSCAHAPQGEPYLPWM